jgi:hypothetical protein
MWARRPAATAVAEVAAVPVQRSEGVAVLAAHAGAALTVTLPLVGCRTGNGMAAGRSWRPTQGIRLAADPHRTLSRRAAQDAASSRARAVGGPRDVERARERAGRRAQLAELLRDLERRLQQLQGGSRGAGDKQVLIEPRKTCIQQREPYCQSYPVGSTLQPWCAPEGCLKARSDGCNDYAVTSAGTRPASGRACRSARMRPRRPARSDQHVNRGRALERRLQPLDSGPQHGRAEPDPDLQHVIQACCARMRVLPRRLTVAALVHTCRLRRVVRRLQQLQGLVARVQEHQSGIKRPAPCGSTAATTAVARVQEHQSGIKRRARRPC